MLAESIPSSSQRTEVRYYSAGRVVWSPTPIGGPFFYFGNDLGKGWLARVIPWDHALHVFLGCVHGLEVCFRLKLKEPNPVQLSYRMCANIARATHCPLQLRLKFTRIGRIAYKGLRERLMFRRRGLYYLAIGLDFILRFGWTATVIPHDEVCVVHPVTTSNWRVHVAWITALSSQAEWAKGVGGS